MTSVVACHHESMPGRTCCVHPIPELDACTVLQNSLDHNDRAGLLCQFLSATLLDTKEPNEYLKIAVDSPLNDMGHTKKEL